jgi:hypothetical protein
VRLALVHDLASTNKAMRRIAEIYGAR